MTLRDYATTFGGREELSVRAFANAMEIIPKTLIENAGGDPLDKIVELRSAPTGNWAIEMLVYQWTVR